MDENNILSHWSVPLLSQLIQLKIYQCTVWQVLTFVNVNVVKRLADDPSMNQKPNELFRILRIVLVIQVQVKYLHSLLIASLYSSVQFSLCARVTHNL